MSARAAVAPRTAPARHRPQILLASEGRPISRAALDEALRLAREREASVRVISIARVHGVSLGMPVPGLLPTRAEWEEQAQIVRRAVARLRRGGIEAEGRVVGTRTAAKRICAEAAAHQCELIVMAADAYRHRILGDMLWSQEPQRVRRRARVPVVLTASDPG